MFSIRDRKSKRVSAHGNCFTINNVTTKISETSRQRVIREKRKNVHAYLLGNYQGEFKMDTTNLQECYYNPYTLDSFIIKETEEKLDSIGTVYFDDCGKCWIVEM